MHLCSCLAGYQDLPSFQCLQVIHRDGALVRALSNCKELFVGGNRQSGDALAFWRTRSESLHLCLDIVGHHSVSDRVYDGALLNEVDVVLDISSQSEDMPATIGSGQAQLIPLPTVTDKLFVFCKERQQKIGSDLT